jgi:hypothetical protein
MFNHIASKKFNHFISSVDEGLMRVQNAAVGPMDPLRGPNGYLPAPITTRDELSFATGEFCGNNVFRIN